MRIAALCAVGLLLVAARKPDPIDYSVGYAGPGSLEVAMRMRGNSGGRTAIHLPERWAGVPDLWKGVSGLTVDGGRVSGEGAVRTIVHRGGAPLVIRYKIASGGDESDSTGEKARPIVHADWFFFHGEGVFAVPEDRPSAKARFRWGRLPNGWKAASDLDELTRQPGTLDELVESVGIAGRDLAVVRSQAAGAPLRVAVIGKWTFTPQALAETIRVIVAAEHRMWRDRPAPFLVAMAPFKDNPRGETSTGTGRGDAFSLLSTSGFDLDHARRLLAHEYMHHWMAAALGGLPDEDPQALYWFSEGFDDYLTDRALLASGLWSLEDFFANKNEVLLRYASSPARTASGAELGRKFWLDDAYGQMGYDRGHLLAILLEARIRQASGGRIALMDVFRRMRDSAAGHRGEAAARFPAVLREVPGLDLKGEISRIVDKGIPIVLPADPFGGCARVVEERRAAFHRGFDSDATAAAGMVVKGVDPSGPAYAAGLREGMKILRREAGAIGDSSKEIAYRVVDGRSERIIRYFPRGKESLTTQVVRPSAAGPADRARCSALLGG
jgi:predicted metalloprotease with PDZ domain